MVHLQAAFKNNTLGLPKICPPESIDMTSRSHLYTYLQNYHTPDRMVVAGVGIEHKKLVDIVQRSFVEKTPIWEENPGLIESFRGRDLSLAQYTGGMVQVGVL